MTKPLPVGTLDMSLLSGLLARYTTRNVLPLAQSPSGQQDAASRTLEANTAQTSMSPGC